MDHARDESWPGVLDEVTGALETLTSALEGEDDFTVLMQRMCEQATKAVPGVDEATLTLLTDGALSPRPPRATSPPHWTATSTPPATAPVCKRPERVNWCGCRSPRSRTGGQRSSETPMPRDSVASCPRRWRSPTARPARSTATARGHGFAELDEKLLDLYTSTATALLRTYARYQGP
jgi:hypothetical protein